MTKVLVLYYSSYGHIEKMASAVAEGVRETGAEAVIKRVPELAPEDIARKSGFRLDQPAPIARLPSCPNMTPSSSAFRPVLVICLRR